MGNAFEAKWTCFAVTLEGQVAHIRLNRPALETVAALEAIATWALGQGFAVFVGRYARRAR